MYLTYPLNLNKNSSHILTWEQNLVIEQFVDLHNVDSNIFSRPLTKRVVFCLLPKCVRKLPGGGPKGFTLGQESSICQSSNNANCTQIQERVKWMNDFIVIEILN